MALFRDAGESGALFEVSGTIPTGATWSEDIYFSESGAASDLTGLDFKMTFRADPDNTGADITLSISGGELTIVDDDDGNARILRIGVTADTLDGYSGDYICDLASQDENGTVTLWAHGVVTFRQNPVKFS